jgi:peptidoglycan/xylan/chitin deacetylase (PgdA/CDA1 family)
MTVFHAFRYDDFSAASCTVVEERLIEMLLTHAIPCTFAAVPFVCDPNSLLSGGAITLVPLPKSKADLLKPLLRRKLAEVALHGYAHLSLSRIRGQQEFSDAMPIATQRALLRRGKEHLEHVFETPVRLFVPPWNRLSATTAVVLEEEGFQVSDEGGASECPEASRLARVPCPTLIRRTSAALRLARRWGESNLVGTVIHDYDFTESGLAPDSLTTKEFEALLVAWSRTPDVRPISLSAFLDSGGVDGHHRLEANAALQREVVRSRLAFRLLRDARDVYWDTRAARSLTALSRILP